MIRTLSIASTTLLSLYLSALPAIAGTTAITECGKIIDSPGKYKLTQDLLLCPDQESLFFGPSLGAITIASSGVRLDLQGHSITCNFVDDLVPNPEALIGTGILVQPGFTDIHIKNGSISNCNTGVALFGTADSSVKKMNLVGNRTEFGPLGFGQGIVVVGGSNVLIQNNRMSGNENQGIVMAQGGGNRVKANTVTQNFGTGIEAFFESNTKYLCNQSSQNGRGGIALAGSGSGNLVRGNVATENGATGITMFGRSDLPPGEFPIPEGNLVKRNIAWGNAAVDLSENLFDVTTGLPSIEDGAPCRNTWSKNEFVSEFGPEMCFGSPVLLDDDDVCALDDDDDDGDDD